MQLDRNRLMRGLLGSSVSKSRQDGLAGKSRVLSAASSQPYVEGEGP